MNKPAAPDRLELRWHARLLGWLFPLMTAACVLFAFAAFEPSLASELSHQRLGGNLFRVGQDGPRNWMSAALSVYAGTAAVKWGWRWADRTAVSADADGLALHRSTFQAALPWSEVSAVRYWPSRTSGRLIIQTLKGNTVSIPMVDPHQGPEFAAAVTARWLSPPASPSSPRAT